MSNANSLLRRAAQFLAPGLISALVLLILLLFAAALANSLPAVQNTPALTSRLCLTLAAILCGLLRARGCETGKLPAALSGEAVLLVILLLYCLCSGQPIFRLSLGLDLLCLAFGGFAGTLLSDRGGRRKHRRK